MNSHIDLQATVADAATPKTEKPNLVEQLEKSSQNHVDSNTQEENGSQESLTAEMQVDINAAKLEVEKAKLDSTKVKEKMKNARGGDTERVMEDIDRTVENIEGAKQDTERVG
ncbi:hypothetical protein CC78DRAFT_604301 [Lojkania enalia]|uniref:Uncharacterized protein n=1 Tax=Lojkania enalia TaxID=147567 RepID=A0A9P4NAD2_9PLEO|nr:hypothetical protein CC78DRAFT_604301 [Didymosphaeria enalia]